MARITACSGCNLEPTGRDCHDHRQNEDAIVWLVGAILLEQNDEWAVCRRYLTLETLASPGGSAEPIGSAGAARLERTP